MHAGDVVYISYLEPGTYAVFSHIAQYALHYM